MIIRQGVKVITTDRRSAFAHPNKYLCKHYPIGEWVYRNTHLGPLMLFSDLCYAEDFIESHVGSQDEKLMAVLCEYVPSRQRLGKRYLRYISMDSVLANLSFDGLKKTIEKHGLWLPYQYNMTVFANAIRCLE